MSQPVLTAEQRAEAGRVAEILMESARRENVVIAEFLASMTDDERLGRTEFEVRDHVCRIGESMPSRPLSTSERIGGSKDPA